MPTPLPEVPPARECPMCGYPRDGISEPTCPECGYTLTDEDKANGYRWQMFLLFTRWSVWRRWVAIGVVALFVLGFRDYDRHLGPIVVFIVGCVSAAGAIAGSRFVPTRGLRGRALRRCWLLAAAYAQLCWLLPGLVYLLPWQIARHVLGSSSGEYSGEDLSLMLAVSGLLGTAMGLRAFKWTCRGAGLTLNALERVALLEGLKVALAPLGLVMVVASVFWVLRLIDWLWPRWWMDV